MTAGTIATQATQIIRLFNDNTLSDHPSFAQALRLSSSALSELIVNNLKFNIKENQLAIGNQKAVQNVAIENIDVYKIHY